MKRRNKSFDGTRPVFTGSPSVEVGGFNLDTANQNFVKDDVICEGTLCRRDEAARTVRIVKTGKVTAIDEADAKIITLESDAFLSPVFAVGDAVLKTVTASNLIANAPTITAISNTNSGYVITLSKEIDGLAVGDVLQQVVADGTKAVIIKANAVVAADRTIGEDGEEVIVDVCADTMQYAVYERRILPVVDAQKSSDGFYLAENPHIRFTQML